MAFAQIMKVYSGRRMVDFFALNFAEPTNSTMKLENRKGVKFIAGEHQDIFKLVIVFYQATKAAYGIVGLVPIILVEDETKVKSWIAW